LQVLKLTYNYFTQPLIPPCLDYLNYYFIYLCLPQVKRGLLFNGLCFYFFEIFTYSSTKTSYWNANYYVLQNNKIYSILTMQSIHDRRSRKMDCSSVQLRIPRSQVPSLQSEILFFCFTLYCENNTNWCSRYYPG
jgi:hypothetical protein